MKKIFSLILAMFLFLGVNANAKELKDLDLNGSKMEATEFVKKDSKYFYEIDDEVENYKVDPDSVTSTSFIKTATIVEDGATTTYKQYFVAQNGKWVHTKTESTTIYETLKFTGLETFYTDSNISNCSPTTIDPNDVKSDSCVVIKDRELATKRVVQKIYGGNKLYSETYIDLSKTNEASTYFSRSYYSNGKVSDKTHYITYSNGSVNTKKSYSASYNSKGKITSKATFHNYGEIKFFKTYKYHSNNKIKKFEIANFKSDGKTKYHKKTTYTNKGKKVFHQNAKFNSAGYLTTILQYKYNKNGALKSTKKAGSAYRIKRVVTNGKVTKSYKANYNNKGKLQKAKKIKTKKTKISYYTEFLNSESYMYMY